MTEPTLETLEHDLHGEGVGRAGQHIYCDYCAGDENRIDPSKPICYEAIAIVDLENIETLFNPPTGWVLDAARCTEHAVAALEHPTHGYEEALIELEVVPFGEIGYTVDSTSIRVLDHSPGDEGLYPILVTLAHVAAALKKKDFGIWRVSRHIPLLELYEWKGLRHYCTSVQMSLERGPYSPSDSDTRDNEQRRAGGA